MKWSVPLTLVSSAHVVGIATIVSVTGAGCAHGEHGTDGSGLTMRADASYLYGPIHGRLQTPTGGKPGTTTAGRPTLAELGIDRAHVPDVAAAVDWDHHEIYAGYRAIRVSGNSTLSEPLISQGHHFSAGTPVHSDVTLDWARVGYRHLIPIDLSGDGKPDFNLYPAAGLAIWNFDYRLDQPGSDDVHRAYILPSPQLGLGVEVPLTSRLSLVANVLASLPVGNEPRIYSGEVTAQYHLFDLGGAEFDGTLGAAFDRIDYRSDNQTVPNDISVDLGPMLLFGLSAKF